MDRPCSVCKRKVITVRNCSECDKYFCVKCWIDSRCTMMVAGIPQPHRYNGKLQRVMGSCLVEDITVETPVGTIVRRVMSNFSFHALQRNK